jgi:drug/metabolite transporter (DMT)-like permease
MLITVGGLAFALSPKIEDVGPTAWKGDLIMVSAAALQSVYNVLSKPYIQRIGALRFTAFGMAVGAVALVAVCIFGDFLQAIGELDSKAWVAIVYLGIFGNAVLWVLWAIGLQYASPSLVALTNTVNTLTASFLGALILSEPLGIEFAVGFICVVIGIVIATDLAGRKIARSVHGEH